MFVCSSIQTCTSITLISHIFSPQFTLTTFQASVTFSSGRAKQLRGEHTYPHATVSYESCFLHELKILQELTVFFSNQVLPEASKRTACKFLINTLTTFLHLCKPGAYALIHNYRKSHSETPAAGSHGGKSSALILASPTQLPQTPSLNHEEDSRAERQALPALMVTSHCSGG